MKNFSKSFRQFAVTCDVKPFSPPWIFFSKATLQVMLLDEWIALGGLAEGWSSVSGGGDLSCPYRSSGERVEDSCVTRQSSTPLPLQARTVLPPSQTRVDVLFLQVISEMTSCIPNLIPQPTHPRTDTHAQTGTLIATWMS